MKLGIDPPKGVLLFGPPGTGKTLCARAVANRTDACFIRVIGSELVQKYVGEVRFVWGGARWGVRDRVNSSNVLDCRAGPVSSHLHQMYTVSKQHTMTLRPRLLSFHGHPP